MLLLAAGGALSVAGIAGLAYLHLRHLGLLLLALLTPVPALAAVVFLMSLGTAAATSAGLAYLADFSIGLVLAGDLALLVCGGADARSATHAVLRGHGLVLGSSLSAIIAAVLPLALIGDAAMAALTGAVLAGAGGLAAIGGICLARFLPYDENFVTRRNRVQERWNRIFNRLIAVARPRWGFSMAGIALVFAVLGFFGAQSLKVPAETASDAPMIFSFMGVGVLTAIAAATRDWRILLAAALALCPALLAGLWGLARLALPLDAKNLLFLVLAFGIGMVPAIAAAAGMGQACRSGDDAAIAAARTLLRSGPGFFFAAAIPALANVLAVPFVGDIGIALAVMLAFTSAGPLLFQPAFAIVIETWLPRPSAVASLYRLT